VMQVRTAASVDLTAVLVNDAVQCQPCHPSFDVSLEPHQICIIKNDRAINQRKTERQQKHIPRRTFTNVSKLVSK
jgi:hypothetical protein